MVTSPVNQDTRSNKPKTLAGWENRVPGLSPFICKAALARQRARSILRKAWFALLPADPFPAVPVAAGVRAENAQPRPEPRPEMNSETPKRHGQRWPYDKSTIAAPLRAIIPPAVPCE
jgi:hypothetical protein